MKPKLLLCLALVLSGIFTSQYVYGFVAEIQINHQNLQTDYSFLKVKTTRLDFTNNPVVYFTFIVTPKDKQQQAHNFEGNLTINDPSEKDSHKVIGYTAVMAQKLSDESIRFQFSVAGKYLKTSEFRVEESVGKFGDVGADYIFNLKEFADEK